MFEAALTLPKSLNSQGMGNGDAFLLQVFSLSWLIFRLAWWTMATAMSLLGVPTPPSVPGRPRRRRAPRPHTAAHEQLHHAHGARHHDGAGISRLVHQSGHANILIRAGMTSTRFLPSARAGQNAGRTSHLQQPLFVEHFVGAARPGTSSVCPGPPRARLRRCQTIAGRCRRATFCMITAQPLDAAHEHLLAAELSRPR